MFADYVQKDLTAPRKLSPSVLSYGGGCRDQRYFWFQWLVSCLGTGGLISSISGQPLALLPQIKLATDSTDVGGARWKLGTLARSPSSVHRCCLLVDNWLSLNESGGTFSGWEIKIHVHDQDSTS